MTNINRTNIPKSKVSKLDSFLNGNEKFLASRIAFFLFGSLFFSIGIIQFTLFSLGYEISGFTKYDDDAWIEWMLIALFMVGSATNIFSTICTINMKKSFFYWQLVATVCFVISDVFIHLWYDLIKYVILTLLYLQRKIAWDKKEAGELVPTKLTRKGFIIHISIAIAISLAFGFMMYFLDKYGIFSDVAPFSDAFIMVFVLYGSFLLVTSKKESWILFFIADTIYVITMGRLGYWNPMILSMIYMYTDVITGLIWSRKLKRINSKVDPLNEKIKS